MIVVVEQVVVVDLAAGAALLNFGCACKVDGTLSNGRGALGRLGWL